MKQEILLIEKRWHVYQIPVLVFVSIKFESL